MIGVASFVGILLWGSFFSEVLIYGYVFYGYVFLMVMFFLWIFNGYRLASNPGLFVRELDSSIIMVWWLFEA